MGLGDPMKGTFDTQWGCTHRLRAADLEWDQSLKQGIIKEITGPSVHSVIS